MFIVFPPTFAADTKLIYSFNFVSSFKYEKHLNTEIWNRNYDMKIENIIELRKIIVSCVLSCSSFITYKSRLFHFVKYARMRVSSDPYFFQFYRCAGKYGSEKTRIREYFTQYCIKIYLLVQFGHWFG